MPQTEALPKAAIACGCHLQTPDCTAYVRDCGGTAVKLTTRAFAELKANPKIGRAEALRRSMREMIEKGTLAEVHPSMWAPFVVVGEGAGDRGVTALTQI